MYGYSQHTNVLTHLEYDNMDVGLKHEIMTSCDLKSDPECPNMGQHGGCKGTGYY